MEDGNKEESKTPSATTMTENGLVDDDSMADVVTFGSRCPVTALATRGIQRVRRSKNVMFDEEVFRCICCQSEADEDM